MPKQENILPIQPFADESACLQINGMTVENRLDRVSVFGSLDFTRDKLGFAMARQFKISIDAVVLQLEKDNAAGLLPESIKAGKSAEIGNPFEEKN